MFGDFRVHPIIFYIFPINGCTEVPEGARVLLTQSCLWCNAAGMDCHALSQENEFGQCALWISTASRRKFRSQTSDNMDRSEKHRQEEEAQTRRKPEERRSAGESRKRADAGARKGRKVAKDYVFPMICGSGGSKSRLAR